MEILKLIIDTDMGSDCDDVPAVALAAWMQKTGQAELLGVTHTSDNKNLYSYVDSVVRFYGGFDTEIAVCDGKVPEIGRISDEFIAKVTDGFDCRKAPANNIGSAKLLRKLLAKNKNVKIVCIGPLNNIAALLKSEGDEYSPLCGKDLVAASVSEFAVMGGIFDNKIYRFGNEIYDVEFNIKCDVEGASFVVENSPVPITFIEFELGNEVESFYKTVMSETDSPIRRSFELFGVKKRSSWDPITVLYTKYGLCGGIYKYSPWGKVTIDKDGRFTFVEGKGNHRYLIENASKSGITDYVNSFENKISGGII